MIANLICMLAVGVLGSIHIDDDVRIRVHLMGPTQPIADVEIGMISECSSEPGVLATYARTNSEGWAELIWRRCDRDVVQIFTASRLGDTEVTVPAAATQAELQRLDDLGTGPYVKLVQVPPAVLEHVVEFPAPGGRNVKIQLDGDFASVETAFLFSEEMRMPIPHAVSPVDHSITVKGIRRGEAFDAYLKLGGKGKDLCARVIPIHIPAGNENIDLVSVNVPAWTPTANIDLTVHREFTPSQRPRETFGRFFYAFETLISSDGNTIVTFGRTQDVREPGSGLGPDRFRRKIPAGTYYYSPGPFEMGGAGPRLLQRIQGGEDLTNSGIPRFTVATGETATLEYSWVSAWQAIFQTP